MVEERPNMSISESDNHIWVHFHAVIGQMCSRQDKEPGIEPMIEALTSPGS